MQGKRLLALWASSILALALYAQPKDNSPITRYGLGDLYSGDFNQTGAVGGLFAAWSDPYRVNPVNPAGLPFLKNTALEVGFFSRYNQFSRKGNSQGTWSGNLDYISLGIPLKSQINELLEPSTSPWTLATGVQVSPYSLVGYDVEFTQVIPGVDSVRNIFRGEGGLTQAAWSFAAKYKEFSLGLQAGYIFGRVENNSQLDLLGNRATYSTREFSAINVRGVVWQTGLLYRIALDKPNKESNLDRQRRWLQIGAYGGTNGSYVSRSENLLQRVNIDYSGGGAVARDTLVNEVDSQGSGFLPARFGAGLTLQKGDYYQVGVNAEWRNWEGFQLDGKTETGLSYRGAWRFGIGGEWTPDASSFKQYLHRIRYRAGLIYEQDPRIIGDKTWNGYALQVGMGFPVLLPRQQVSFLDLALEAGFRGDDSVQQDTYIRIRMAATLNDNSWFFKRKYN